MKKELIAFLLALSVSGVVFAEDQPDIVRVDKCTLQDNITANSVKHVEKGLFLDEGGNKVQPCRKGETLVFRIIGHYPDGKSLFDNSKNPVLNKGNYDDMISVNYNKDYSITYGNSDLNIEDIDSFLHKKRKEDFDLLFGKSVETDYSVVQIEELLKIPNSLQPSEKYVNAITEEKETDINTKYKDFLNQSNTLIAEAEPVAKNIFIDNAVKYNRQIIFDNNVVNQYSEDNGILFDLYKASYGGLSFQKDVQAYVSDFISNQKKTRDEKLALLELLEKTDLSNIGNTVINDGFSDWLHSLSNLSELETRGTKEFKGAETSNISNFQELIKIINKEIVDKEFNALPNRINQKQYRALSDIDKYKYIPEMKNGFTNKDFYVKNNQDVTTLKLIIK